jgi:cell division protein ZapA
MPLVNVMVNSKAYTIACDEGEEEHLRQLAAIVDGKVRELLGSVGNVGDLRLLLMAALLIADEHHGGRIETEHTPDAQARGELEARAKAAESRASAAMEQLAAQGNLHGELEARIKAAEDQAASAMEQTAAKLERIAASLAAA